MTVPATANVPQGQTTGTFTASVASITSNLTAQITASYNGTSQSFILTATAPAQLSSINCAPSSLGSNASSTCTVSLNKAATASMTVAIGSSVSALTVPSSVTIANGQSSTTFSATTGTVSSTQTASVTASLNGVQQSTTVTVTVQVVPSSLTCSATSVTGPASTNCTITLSGPAPSGGAVVNVSSNNGSVTVPSTVSIVFGQSSGSFTANAASVTSNQLAQLIASYNGTSQSFNLTDSAPLTLSSVSCSPSTLGSNSTASCSVSLSGPASSAVSVALASSAQALTVPGSVTISVGQTSSNFSVSTGTVTSSQNVNVTATLNGQQQSTVVNLTATVVLSSLSCSPGTVAAPGSANCTVTLSGPAPAGGAVVNLSSNNPSVTVPGSATVTSGQTSVSFTATVAGISANLTAQISASYNGGLQLFTLSATAAVQLTSVSCAPSALGSNASTTCTVTLSGAPATAVAVAITSSSTVLSVPPTVTITLGQTSTTFSATTGTVGSTQAATVTATLNGVQQSTSVSFTGVIIPSSLVCSPGSVIGPGSSNCTVTLSAPAPAGGAVIALSSNTPSVTVPTSVSIIYGQSTVSFTASVMAVTSNQIAELVATYNSVSQSFNLTDAGPLSLSSLVCSPSTIGSNSSTNCTVSLSQPAVTAVTISIAAGSGPVSVPSTVTIPTGVAIAVFSANTSTVTTSAQININATWNGQTKSASVNVTTGALLSGFTCASASLANNASTTCSVAITNTATNLVTVQLSQTGNYLSFPNQVTITSGLRSASFTVTNNSGGATGVTAVITASLNGLTESAQLAIGGAAESFAGSMPDVLAEGGWNTTFTFVNKTSAPVETRNNLFDDNGNPLSIPLAFPQPQLALGSTVGATVDQTLAPNASFIMQATGPAGASYVEGSSQIFGSGTIDGFAIFHYDPTAQEAIVPLETRNAGSYLLAFDNTNSDLLGIAIENITVQSVSVPIVLRDDTGAQIGTGTIPLNGNGHVSFVLSTQFPVTANIRGTIEIDTPGFGSPNAGQISVLGIRYTPSGALTTTPALANVGTTGGTVAHIASGAGWVSTFVLVNTGLNAAQAYLNYLDDNGNPLPLPLLFPQSNATSMESTVTQNIAPGASLWVQTTGAVTDALLSGSVQLVTTGNVSGFLLLRYTPNGQEAVVPFETRNANAYMLAFDNTNGTATGVAVSSVSAQSTNVQVILRDDTGAQVGTGTIPLAADGHTAFVLSDQFGVTANIRGTIEFDTPPGAHIAVVGIRSPPALTFTSLPALAK